WQGETVRALGQSGALGLGWRLLVPHGAIDSLEARLLEGGASALSPGAYEAVRVEAGFPAAGRELTDAYTPLETGLHAAIHTAKGCYTGQEVIARQINYDKITRQMVGLRLDAPVEPGAVVQDRKSTRLNSSHVKISYAVFCLTKKMKHDEGGGWR